MKVLLDVNILLACGWKQHQHHSSCSLWLNKQKSFSLCPITELGFLRISMSPAFNSSFADAATVLQSFSQRPQAMHIPCDQTVSTMTAVTSYKDTTDAYLVHLAFRHGHQLATLDAGILNKKWATNIAFNPMAT